jgi:hypothetical protein
MLLYLSIIMLSLPKKSAAIHVISLTKHCYAKAT